MKRAAPLAIVAALSSAAVVARADVTPPARSSILLELTVDNQEALPFLRFVATNCYEPPEMAVLDPKTPVLCHPTQGPVRIFGFRVGDLPDFLDMIKRNADSKEAASFMAAKAKTCGQVRDEDVIFLASTDVAFVAARYALEPGPKGGCKLTRVSATTKTSQEIARSPDASAPQSAGSSAPSPSPASSSSPVAAPPASGCGCRTAPTDARAPGLVAVATALSWLGRRRRRLMTAGHRRLG